LTAGTCPHDDAHHPSKLRNGKAMIDTEYARMNLADARARLMAARARYDSAKTKFAKREAAEDIEFYGNRAAYLAAALNRTAA